MDAQSRAKFIDPGPTTECCASGESSACKSYGARAVAAAIVGLAAGITPLLTGCATATSALANLTAAEAETIDLTCEQTLGAQRGGSYFEACRSSLADAVQRQDASRKLAQAQVDCARAGLKESSSELALCVLGARPPATLAVSMPPRSLASASRDEIHRRAELSCAKLGLNPAAPGFTDCVAELEASISQADNPSS